MPDDAADDFLSAALAAVDGKDDNAEVRQLLTGELTRATEGAPEETLQEAAGLLRAGKPARDMRLAGRLTALLVVLIVLSCMAFNAWSFYLYRKAVAVLTSYWDGDLLGMTDLLSAQEIPGLSHPTAHQRLLILGMPGREGKADRYEALADSEPGNASYYAAHIRSVASHLQSLPPDFIARTQATDPGNGMLFLAAMGRSSFKKIDRDKAANTYRITNPAAFEEAMGYFHLAAASPFLRSRAGEIAEERLRALPRQQDYLAATSDSWLLSTQDTYVNINPAIGNYLCAAAQKCDAAHDADAFLRLSGEWRSVCDKLLENPLPSMMDLLMVRAVLTQTAPVFSAVATDLGQDSESLYYARISAGLDRLKLEVKDSRAREEAGYSYASGGSLLPYCQMFLIPPSHPEELAPERLALHSFFQRLILFLGSGAVLLLAGAAAAYRFRSSALSRRLAEILHRMSWRKGLPIGITAALAPLLLSAIHIWSPAGATHWNVFWGGLILANLQAAAALVLALLLPLQVARLTLRRRAIALIGVPPGGFTLWSGWAACGCAVAAWIVSAFIPGRAGFEELFTRDFRLLAGVGKPVVTGACATLFWIACGLLAAAVLWLIFIAIRAVFSSRSCLPRRLATARLLLPAWLAALFLLAILQPLLHVVERSYVSRSPLQQRSERNPQISMVEERIVETTYRRFREIIAEAKSAS